MHDLDDTLGESEPFADLEPEFDELESMDDPFEEALFESDEPLDDDEDDTPLDDATEMELAAELLATSDDDELERVVNKAMRRPPPNRRRRRRSASPQRKRRRKFVGGLLKTVAKKALPGIGAALGGVVPIVGPALGAAVGKAAAGAIHPELEGLGPDDLDFETARKVVRLASEAADNVEQVPPAVQENQAAKAAVTHAARRHAPRLVRRKGAPGPRPAGGPMPAGGAAGGGRWIRRGRKIVLLGV